MIRSIILVVFTCLGTIGLADNKRGTAEEAIEMVISLSDFYANEGLEATLSSIIDKSGPFIDRDLFVIIWDQEGYMVGHGRNSPAVGTNRMDAKDANGVYITRQILEAANSGGGWVPYRFLNHTTGVESDKTTFVLTLDDNLVAGVGIYAD